MVRDSVDEQTQLLRAIAHQLGAIDMNAASPEVNVSMPDSLPGQAAQNRPIHPSSLVITETSDLDEANEDGTVTLNPGEEAVIARQEARVADGMMLLAAGATDKQDAEYFLRFDNDVVVGGSRNSPLGTLNTPFSFVENYSGVPVAEDVIEYVVRYDTNASGELNIAGRMHIERL